MLHSEEAVETLAFLHIFVAYEDRGESPQLRSLEELNVLLHRFTILKIAGGAMALSMLATFSSYASYAAVERGDVCPTVQAVQESLIRKGHDPGPVNGIFGPATEYAVMRFQQKHGLTPTRVVDAATASALGMSSDAACGSAAGNKTTGFVKIDPARPKKDNSIATKNITDKARVSRSSNFKRSSIATLPKQKQPVRATRVVVKRGERRVYVYQGQQELASFPVAVGKPRWETPIGNFHVSTMLKNPGWTHPLTGEVMPPDSNNPLGERWIEFWTDGFNSIGFHGTPNRESVGQAASHGCVRMYNEDVEKLYAWVSEGTPVIVED